MRSRLPRSLWIPLGFIVLALLALVLVPIYHAAQVREVELEVTRTLEPARRLASRLSVAQAEQMASLQAFVLSGEGRFRLRYRTARRTEEAVFDSLYALSEEMGLPVREQMVGLWNRSTRWHLGHQPIIEGEQDRATFGSALDEEQRAYEELVARATELQDAISRAVEDGRLRMERARGRQIGVTLGLVLLALGATGAVAFLGWKLFSLSREAEGRRDDAVAARREIDAVLTATGDGVLGVDLEGRCTFLNRAGEDLLGIPARRLMGHPVHELIHHSRPDGSPYPEEECPLHRSLERGESRTAQQECLWRPDGSCFPAQLSVRPLVDGRESRGAVLTFTDLTEVRRTEEELRKAVRARDEVVAVVSHDLRNPLSTVSAASELLLELDLPPEKRRVHLEAIARSANRMGRLIQDLLDVASMEAGALSVELRPVEPDRLLEEAREMSAVLMEGEGLTLDVAEEAALPEVMADPDRILQVFSNLVSNAVRFTPPGGRIVLRAARGAREVVMGVDDTGPGVPKEDRDHLFDRFWKLDRNDREGAGLGLAIVKGIVESHGGRVWIEDGPDGGACFRFTLPVVVDEYVPAVKNPRPGPTPPAIRPDPR